jgi:TetR/AcrR family fatty acid metabolism transcriptional regulator
MAEKSKDRDRPTFIEEARRKQIIDSTIQTLANRGFINTTLAEIADQIGVSKGVISYHFNGKDELIDATLDTIIETQVSIRQERIDEQSEPLEKMRAYFRANIEFLKNYPTYIPALLELWASYSSLEAKLYFNRMAYEPARVQLKDIFRFGQERGDFSEFDPLVNASLIQGAIDGIMWQWYFNPEKVDPDAYIEELLSIFEKYILANPS